MPVFIYLKALIKAFNQVFYYKKITFMNLQQKPPIYSQYQLITFGMANSINVHLMLKISSYNKKNVYSPN